MSVRRLGENKDLMFKIIIIGDSGTGKSCLMNRYVKDEFNDVYHSTIGTEFQSKQVAINQDWKVKLQIWDTAGQESFRSIIKSFFRNAGAVLLTYSIASRASFQNLKEWLFLARDSAPSTALYVLIGTHLDLEERRQVGESEGRSWMLEQGLNLFFQTSSKNDINVSVLFEEVAKQLFSKSLERRRSTESPRMEVLKLKEGSSTNEKNNCCGI